MSTNIGKYREQCWRNGESTGLPPMWHGFETRIGHHILWVEFVGSLLCSEHKLTFQTIYCINTHRLRSALKFNEAITL